MRLACETFNTEEDTHGSQNDSGSIPVMLYEDIHQCIQIFILKRMEHVTDIRNHRTEPVAQ